MAVRTDQRPEFTGKALGQWAYQHGVELKLIQPGNPMQMAMLRVLTVSFGMNV